jgi:hypothetical protein
LVSSVSADEDTVRVTAAVCLVYLSGGVGGLTCPVVLSTAVLPASPPPTIPTR